MDALFGASKTGALFNVIIKLGRARILFHITPTVFNWKKKVYIYPISALTSGLRLLVGHCCPETAVKYDTGKFDLESCFEHMIVNRCKNANTIGIKSYQC